MTTTMNQLKAAQQQPVDAPAAPADVPTEDVKEVDPTTDKDPSHWEVTTDPPPDVSLVYFHNGFIGYGSYNPPRGFTAEEIMEFGGAKDCMTLEGCKEFIKKRDEKGSLDLTGDARWA